jgi:hypothetical protein
VVDHRPGHRLEDGLGDGHGAREEQQRLFHPGIFCGCERNLCAHRERCGR